MTARRSASWEGRPPVVFLMGPTASGKTTLALELACRVEVDLISVDSSLVYRGLDIGSAKPDAATLRRFPHALIDVREPHQTYSAGDFAGDARAAIKSSHARGRLPLLVGGTGLYFRALERGLSPLPAAEPGLRKAIAAEAATLGWSALHARLARLDPDAARHIHRNDPQRIGRALEVIELTGRKLSDQQRAPLRSVRGWRLLKLIASTPDRAALHARIAARLDAMWDSGFVAEVRKLLDDPAIDRDTVSMRAVGYRQVARHLRGDYDFAECRRRALHASRQLAKRQLTWLRGEHDAIAMTPHDPGVVASRVEAFLR